MKRATIFSFIFLIAVSAVFGAATIPISIVLNYNNSKVEKKVAAFYYGWYSNTTDYTQTSPVPVVDNAVWRHWEGNGYTPPVNACSMNTPQIGWYDSADPATIERHLRQAEWAGIDAFVVSYWGMNGFELANFRIMQDVAKYINSNISLTLYFEIFMGGLDTLPEADAITFLGNELVVVYNVLTNASYADIIWFEQDKPVLFVYVVQAVSPAVWEGAMKIVGDNGAQFFLVADRPGNSKAINQYFQGTHQYDVYAPTYHGTYFDDYFEHKRNAYKYKQVFISGVAPGYDDHKVRPYNPALDREEGETYRKSWSRAISLNPDWISITSWNEWHEGSEIEPSVENSNLALVQTRDFVAEFKSGQYIQLEKESFYTGWILNGIIALGIAWVFFILSAFVTMEPKFVDRRGLNRIIGFLLTLAAWAVAAFYLIYEVILNNFMEITNSTYIFILPTVLVLHSFGCELLLGNTTPHGIETDKK